MTETDLKLLLLEKHLPDECDAVGLTYLNEIIENETEYIAAAGGSYIDLEVVITVLIGTVELIEKAIKVYKFYKEKQGKPPTPSDLKDGVESELTSVPNIDVETRENIYYDIADYLRKLEAKNETF